jgi:hypothetical protein
MSIEGNALANTLANSAAENAYRNAQTTRDALPAATTEDVNNFMGWVNNTNTPLNEPQTIASTQNNTTMTPGDQMLKALQKISESGAESVKNVVNTVEDIKNSNDFSVSKLLETQMYMMNFQITHELSAKTAGSVNQGIQTLLKNQ